MEVFKIGESYEVIDSLNLNKYIDRIVATGQSTDGKPCVFLERGGRYCLGIPYIDWSFDNKNIQVGLQEKYPWADSMEDLIKIHTTENKPKVFNND